MPKMFSRIRGAARPWVLGTSLLFCCGAGVGVEAAFAQLSTTSTIAGTVTDASGALVPDAAVTITNQGTGISVQRQTTSDGSYVAPGLSVGTYTVTATKAGFQSFVAKNVELHPAVTSTVNAVLNVGDTKTEVTVSAAASEIETTTAENSNSVEATQVNTLPINGRNYQGLTTMMPGAQNTSAGTALTSGGRSTNNVMSINGLQQNKTFYALDGIWNENTGNMGQTTVVPNPDSLEEVRVLQNNYSARYSLLGSSVVLLQTKSGTSQFHGTAWEFLRNDALNSKPYFATSVLPYKENIFGYNIGGPVFIPHLYNAKRDRTFFFWSEQWVILHQTPTGTLTGIVPTANQRAGIFSSPIKNPATGQLYPTNSSGQYYIPTPNANAVALLNALYPLPNYSGGSKNYINRVPQVTDQRDDEIKLDHNFTPKYHLLAEYLDEYQKYEQNSLAGAQSGEIYQTNAETDFTHNKLAQVALSQVFTPNLLNTTNIAMNIFDLDLTLTGVDTVGQVPGYSASLPFAGYISNRIPLITFSGGLGAEGIAAARPLKHAADLDDTVGDDVSYLKGRHFWQTGVTIVFNTKRQNPGSATNGQFSFTGVYSAPTATQITSAGKAANSLDDSLADMLSGVATSFTQTSDQPRVAVHGFEVSPYVEDRIKLTKNVTLTAGVRLYYSPVPSGPTNTETNFIPSAYSISNAPIVASNGTTTQTVASAAHPLNGLLFNGSKSGLTSNFSSTRSWYAGPEIGLAWDVFGDGKTSLRGGYGITYTRIFTNQDCSFACATNPPAIQSVSLSGVNFPNVVGSGTAKPATIAAVSAADQGIQATQVQSYSVGIQHEFAHNFIASATGASSQARHLLGTWNLNQALPTDSYDYNPLIATANYTPYYYQTAASTAAQFSPYPGYAAISSFQTRQNQNWNALELSLKHPVTNSLFFTVAYTYSHDLTDYTSASSTAGTFNVVDPYHPWRYYGNAEGLDFRHSVGITLIYQLPIFAQGNSLWHKTLGGWSFSDITTLRSGTAITPSLSISGQGLSVRPNVMAGQGIAGPKTQLKWFNTAAFTAPGAGHYGNAQTGIIRGPGLETFDMALYKQFHINEATYFEFRAEAFNIFNHTNFTSINAALGNALFGQATAAADPRILEFSGRFHF